MRKLFILLFSFVTVISAVQAQHSKVNLLGRWGKGPSEAVFRRAGYTFVGNGGYLEVYRNQSGSYNRLDDILLPGPVNDIWVQSDTTHIYVACGDTGLSVVHFNYSTGSISGIIGHVSTPGFASGVMNWGNYIYVADGTNGLMILYIGIPSTPQVRGTCPTAGFAHDVWVLNASTALVAAKDAGLYSVNIGDVDNPVVRDSMAFANVFSSKPSPSVYRVLSIDTLAYVAAGWGGMKIVDIRTPDSLATLGEWVYGGTPVDVRDVWVSDTTAYILGHERGLFSDISISDPSNPYGPATLPLNTEGLASAIVVENDSAYVCDGHNGHLVVIVEPLNDPRIKETVAMSDDAFDAEISGQYAYVAVGKSGINVFSTDFQTPRPDTLRLSTVGSYNTGGEARGVVKPHSFNMLYVADGSQGLKVLDASLPSNLDSVGSYIPVQGDTCYDVDVSGSYAYMACGHDGIRIVDVTVPSSIYEVVTPINTPGSARSVRTVDNKVYVADSSGIYVYDISGLPGYVTPLYSITTGDIEAYGIDVSGDSVFVANGQYGFLVWNTVTDDVSRINIGGLCMDITVLEKTIYVADLYNGLRIFDFSIPGVYTEAGYYNTGGRTRRMAVQGGIVGVADGKDGLYILESEIRPEIAVWPTILNFGPVEKEKIRPLVVMVHNPGTTLLRVFDIECNDPIFVFDNETFSVVPGDTQRLVVTFEPRASDVGPKQGSANIYSNADTVNMSLQGRAVSPPQVTQGPYVTDELTYGLWHFDEAQGISVLDASGWELHGQFQGDPQRVSSMEDFEFGGAISFDGDDDYIQIPYDSLFNVWNSVFTAELWFSMITKPVSPDSFYILLRRGENVTNTSQIELALGTEEGFMGSVWDEDGIQHTVQYGSMNTLNEGQWYHLALTWDGDSLRLLVNSVLRDSKPLAGALRYDATQPLAIGSNTGQNAPFYGMIDEVRFSRIARQSWEFRVNHSQLVVEDTVIHFGNVWIDETRMLPLRLRNGGSEPLEIENITISPSSDLVDIPFSTAYYLQVDQDTTIWLSFTPHSQVLLDSEMKLVIQSSDPTFPDYEIPVRGEGVSTLPAGAYSDDPFTFGLWHLDESWGNNIYDASAYEMHGTWNGLERLTGKFNLALLFPTGYDYIGVIRPENDRYISPRWGGFTVEAWFFIEDIQPNRGVLVRRGTDYNSQFDLALNNDRVEGIAYTDQQNSVKVTSQAIITNRWYHAAMVLDQDSLRMYINGTLYDVKAFPGTFAGETREEAVDTLWITLGCDQEAVSPFKGKLDEVRISGINRQPWEFNVNLARFDVSLDSVDFGQVLLGKNRIVELIVENDGLDTLYVDNISSDKTYFEVSNTSLTVASKDYGVIPVTFTPADTVTHVGKLSMETNDPFWQAKEISMVGSGTNTVTIGPYSVDPFTLASYHFDEGSGTVVVDASPAGFNGILQGGVNWTDSGRDDFDMALQFHGGEGWVAIPRDPILNLNHSDFTIEMWFSMVEEPTGSYVLLRRGSQANTNLELSLNANWGLMASLWDSTGVQDTLRSGSMDGFNVDQWYHTALTWDGDYLCLLLNNEVQDSIALDGALHFRTSDSLAIGGSARAGSHFNGMIDEIRFSNMRRQVWEINVKPRKIEVAPYQLDFGKVLLGQSRTLQFVISNRGDQDLNIYEISGAGGVYTLTDSLSDFVVTAWNQQNVRVTYTPDADTTQHSHTTVLVISSNDASNDAVEITLTGNSTDSKDIDPYTADPHTVALYHFDESTGISVIDSSGGNHHGELKNGVARESGFFGNALYFDGVDDYLEIPFSDDLVFDPADESFTIECFFRTDTLSQGLIFMGPSDSANYGFSFNEHGHLEAVGFGTVERQMSDNSWHHVALTYNHLDQMGRFYIDGLIQWSGQRSDTGWNGAVSSLIIGASDSLSGYFEGYIDEVRISDIAREPWEFQLVSYGIEDSLLSTPFTGSSLNIQVKVPTNLSTLDDGVSVYYRNGGATSYASVVAAKEDSITYVATLPSAAINLYGLEYYVRVKNISGSDTLTLTNPVLDPENSPKTASVHHGEIISPNELAYRQYQMISVPFNLEYGSIDSVFSDGFDPYDPYQSRFFWWEPADSVYMEFPDSLYNFNFTPGQAYWIISALKRAYDVGSGQTVTTDSSFQIPINPGWNMIGSPYNFTIRWDDCSLTSDSVLTLYSWDQQEDPAFDLPYMEPWEGYWLYNADSVRSYLYVLPKQADIGKASQIRRGLLTDIQENEWLFKLSAESNDIKDRCNFAGIRYNAKQEWDLLDRPEPPHISSAISLYFDNSQWKNHAGIYAADIRMPGRDGYVWEFVIETDFSEKSVRLYWDLIGDLPAKWGAFLFDLSEGTSTNMIQMQARTYKTNKQNPNYRRFKMVVGTPEFIKDNNDGISIVPVKFHLYHNYPNPFNPATTIKYSLPKNGDVNLTIFNTIGQRVRVLVDEGQKSGYHEVVWNGRDGRGKLVSSGIYIYRLEASSEVATRKMMILR